MKRIKTHHSLFSARPTPLILFVASLGILLLFTAFIPMFTMNASVGSISTIPVSSGLPISSQMPYSSLAQNFTLEGEADMAAFIVGDDGSMTSTMMAAGNVGTWNTAAPYYSGCLLALSIFRWGDYLDVFTDLFSFITNDTSGDGSELEMMMGILDLLPPNAILMIFGEGDPAQIATDAESIHLDFEATIGIDFSHVFGLYLPIPNMTLAIQAYGYFGEPGSLDPIEIQGRDRFQEYMAAIGATRNGASELVTYALANDSIGGVGMAGFLNLGSFSPSSTAMKSSMQLTGSLTIAAWASKHLDKFYGREEQEFNVNEFVDRTGNITIGSLDAFEFTMIFPGGVNITWYTPPGMTNTTSPEMVMVLQTTAHWLNNGSSVDNIIVRFEGDFPPGLSIRKSITPVIPVRGTATVTITLTNIDPNQTVTDVFLDDSHAWEAYLNLPYSSISFTGSRTANYTSLAPGDSVTHTYQVTITGEGGYVAQPANVTYLDDLARPWEKTSNQAYVRVSYTNLFEFLLIILRDIPWSIPVLLLVVLMGIYGIYWLISLLLGIFRRGERAPSSAPPPAEPKVEPEEEFPPPPDEFEPPAKGPPETTCINCGSPIPPGVGFCPACGTKVSD
jgi:hypothetical protein